MGLLKKVSRYKNDRYFFKDAMIILQLPRLALKLLSALKNILGINTTIRFLAGHSTKSFYKLILICIQLKVKCIL